MSWTADQLGSVLQKYNMSWEKSITLCCPILKIRLKFETVNARYCYYQCEIQRYAKWLLMATYVQ